MRAISAGSVSLELCSTNSATVYLNGYPVASSGTGADVLRSSTALQQQFSPGAGRWCHASNLGSKDCAPGCFTWPGRLLLGLSTPPVESGCAGSSGCGLPVSLNLQAGQQPYEVYFFAGASAAAGASLALLWGNSTADLAPIPAQRFTLPYTTQPLYVGFLNREVRHTSGASAPHAELLFLTSRCLVRWRTGVAVMLICDTVCWLKTGV